MNMGNRQSLTDEQVAESVRELIVEGRIEEGLYALLLSQGRAILESRRHTAGKGAMLEEAHSLTVDFLLHIRSKRLAHLRAASHLRRELSKFLTMRESPVYHEVWKALSEALLTLERDGNALRLAPLHGANSQATAWCVKGAEDREPANTERFFDEAAALPVYYPARKDGRLLSPLQAKDLAVEMLALANGPILMQDLHAEAMRHVIPTMAYRDVPDTESEENEPVSRDVADRMHIWGYILEEEAVERARCLWTELEQQGTAEVLCLYYLPKHLLGRPVTGSELGDRNRVSAAGQRIRKAFQKAIDLTPTVNERHEAANMNQRDPSSELPDQQAALLRRMTEILANYCSENSWDRNLK